MIEVESRVSLSKIVRKIIELRAAGVQLTLLAACPNSDAVLEAAVKVAAANNMPMLFAATLNQVDRDGGYTGWTAQSFVKRMEEFATKHRCASPLYPCLDHGGPWLKDVHAIQGLDLDECMSEVKASLTACLEAGYALLHIDPTVDQSLSEGQSLDIGVVVDRTLELIAHAEAIRQQLELPPVSYEVGTEEVHGGLVDHQNFEQFLNGLKGGLMAAGLENAWPCFIVGKVGTDLHTTTFDPESARWLFERVAPLGSLIKGHYTDWVTNPAQYPATGMGGANVGPEFTAVELEALTELCSRESTLLSKDPGLSPSNFLQALKIAVVESNRWRKWLQSHEVGLPFDELTSSRQEWLVATGARYIWTHPGVLSARRQLYRNLESDFADPNEFVVDRICDCMQSYVDAFNLRDSLSRLID
jgi:tagatose-1,6-bisphosphate aldolase non-catalytic subunit AgaZ/GatZ